LILAPATAGARDTTPHACMHAWGVVRRAFTSATSEALRHVST